MRSDFTLEMTYDDDDRRWTVGLLTRTDGVVEICRTGNPGPFAGAVDMERLLIELWRAWLAPQLGADRSASLHDVFCDELD